MNIHKSRLLLGILLALCGAVAGNLIYRYQMAPISEIGVDLDRLAGIKKFVPRPVAWAERSATYEGEDIWVGATIPATGNLDSLKSYLKGPLVPMNIRIFQGFSEISGSLFKSPRDDLGPRWIFTSGSSKPGDSIRWRITEFRALKPGKYWGMADAGKFSKKFKIRVDPVPSSLIRIKELRQQLDSTLQAHPNRMLSPPMPPSLRSDLRVYATLLLSYPENTPLRMEGLRLCAQNILSRGRFEDADSVLFIKLVEQWARESRAEPADIVWYLSRLCSDPLDETCLPQLAKEWGGERMLSYVENWQQSKRKQRDRYSKK